VGNASEDVPGPACQGTPGCVTLPQSCRREAHEAMPAPPTPIPVTQESGQGWLVLVPVPVQSSGSVWGLAEVRSAPSFSHLEVTPLVDMKRACESTLGPAC